MFNRFILGKVFLFILYFCFFANYVTAGDQASEAVLIYGKHNDFDRFVLEYNNKPEYTITGDNYLTILKLPQNMTIIEDESLNKYPRIDLVSRNMDNNEISLVIPSPAIKSFEYNNKIVIDVASYKDIKKQETPKNKKQETLSLHFPWNEDTGLAAFERNGNLWLVFDNYSEPDLSYINTQQSDYISNIVQVPSTNLTILIITTKNNFNISISKKGFNWDIDLSKDYINKGTKNLEALVKESETGYSLYISTKSVKNVITMLDPYTGEILMIAPIVEPNLLFNEPYKYVDLKFLQTYQGVAIEAFADDLIVKKEANGLIIEGLNRALNISPNLEKHKKAK